MPIRVNLREIFPSDPQEINVEKLNFNFNKLLELGVGSPGPIGLTGPQGPAGPIGLTGPQGERGATWWVDAGDPNLITFTGLVDGDMYLDQTSNVFQIWRYDEGTGTWNTVVSIAAIVNSYLSTVSPSPFNTGPTGIPASNTKFVVFDTAGITPIDYINDSTRGILNASNNKTLLLSNFDENIITPSLPLIWPADQNSLYTSIFKIVAAHEDAPTSLKSEAGRYHFEFGSLYNDSTNVLLSDLKHNLKGKFYKRYLTSPELATTNQWINTAKFSLSTPEPFIPTQVDQNGEFEFVVPKYNNEGSTVQEEIYVRIGSAEAFEERTNKAAILADGISITNNIVGRSMVVGLREDLGSVLNLPYSSTNFALFDVSDDVDGLFFNKTLIQTGGNFNQIITSEPVQINSDTLTTVTTSGHFMSQGIYIGSNTIWVSSGSGTTNVRTSFGQIGKYDITNPKNPVKVAGNSGDKGLPVSIGLTTDIDQHGHTTAGEDAVVKQYLGLVHDIAEYGKYVVTVHSRGVAGDNSDLQIHETDSFINRTFKIGSISNSYTNDAYRVQVHGKYAWIITNRTWLTGPRTEGSVNLTQARIAAVDISDPISPVLADAFTELYDPITGAVGDGTKYLDFDINDGKAFVLRYTNYVAISTPPASTHSLDLVMFDVQDPSNFSNLTYSANPGTGLTVYDYVPQKTINLESLTVNTTETEFGGLTTLGNHIYSVWKNNLYISRISINDLISVSSTQLSIESLNACDIKVYGNYAYILVNYTDSTGAIQIWDISDDTSPFLVSETRNSTLSTSSRLAISGKYIYVISNSGNTSELITFDLTGIDSPSATIGAVKTNNLHVDGNAHIKRNLQVKNSLNVGPGGIYVDAGQGITADGKIIGSSIHATGHTAIKVTNNAVPQTIVSSLSVQVVGELDTIEYDALGEFNTSTYKFTASDSGYYLFNFHGSLMNASSSYYGLIASVLLEDSNAQTVALNDILQGAMTSEGLTEYVLNGSRPSMNGSTVLYVEAGDWVRVKYQAYAFTQTLSTINMDMYLQSLTINKIV